MTLPRNTAPATARRPTRRRPLVAALLSAIAPGLGQLHSGHRRRGWMHLVVTLGLVVPAVTLLVMVFYVTGVDLALDLAGPFFRNPTLLLWLLLANILLVAFRAASVADAFLLASPPGRLPGGTGAARAGAAIALVGILAITALPHVWIGHRNLLLHDLLTYDFTADPDQATTTTTPSTTVPTTTVPGTVTSTTTAVPTTTTTTVPEVFARPGRVNILLLGSDAGPGRRGVRTDTMIILSIDPRTGWTAMFSIPRNFIKLPIPETSPARALWPDGLWGDPDNLVWAVYPYGRDHPELFAGPNSGGTAAKEIFGNLVGLDIDFFAMVDLNGFVDIINALGGVEIVVTRRIVEYQYGLEDGTQVDRIIEPGTYRMNGTDALLFARSRSTSDDFDRMGRQRCVLEALARQADPVRLLRELPTLVPAIQQSVITDIPMAVIPDFLTLLAKVDTTQIVSMRFMPNAPEFAGTSTSYIADRIQGYNVPNVSLIRQRVGIAIQLPPEEAIAELNLQPLDVDCGVRPPG